MTKGELYTGAGMELGCMDAMSTGKQGIPCIVGWMQWWMDKGSKQQARSQGPWGKKVAFFLPPHSSTDV